MSQDNFKFKPSRTQLSFTVSIGSKIDENVLVYLEDEDLAIYRRFLNEVAHLHCSEFLKQSFNVSQHLNFSQEFGFDYSVQLPQETHLDSALMRVRPFLLNDEAINFHQVRKRLSRTLSRSELAVSYLKSLLVKFECRDYKNRVTIRKNGEIINSEKYFNHWLNATHYHRDDAKRKKLDEAFSAFSYEQRNAIFTDILIEKITAISGLERMVKLVLDAIVNENDGIE